ncbi:MAG: hypothetical protein ABIT83_02310 [Massilia sp.]
MTESPFYRPSGQVSPRWFGWTALAVFITLPLACLYAWLRVHLPMPVLHLLPALILAACFALASAMAVECGKARSPIVAATTGAAIGLLAWFCQWTLWQKLSGGAAGGPALYALWIVEAAAMSALPAWAAVRQSRKPFCEVTGSWARRQLVPVKFGAIVDEAAFRARIGANPSELFDALNALSPRAPGLATVSLYVCGARNHVYASVENTFIAIENGKEKRSSRVIVKDLRVDCALAEAALRCWHAPLMPAPEPAPQVTLRDPDDGEPRQDLFDIGAGIAGAMLCAVAEAAFDGGSDEDSSVTESSADD